MKKHGLYLTIAIFIAVCFSQSVAADDFSDAQNISNMTRDITIDFRLLGESLKILYVTLNQTSALLTEHQLEYPFLKDLIGDVDNSTMNVGTMINITQTDMTNGTAVQQSIVIMKSNMESPEDMSNSLNQIFNDSNVTTPIVYDMYNDTQSTLDSVTIK